MLLTEWLTIGTAGATIDGREIPDQWLIDAAEQYNLDTYTAVINADHALDWFGSFGTVQQLRTGTNADGKTILQARLNPNQRLVQMNITGQKLFTSMEILPEFADTGRAYLIGLAVTDQPASLGTSPIKFSRAQQPATFSAALPLTLQLPADETTGGFMAALRELLDKFSTGHDIPQTDTPEHEHQNPEQDDAMTPEQFDAIKQQNETLTNAINAQTQAFTAAMEKLGKDSQGDDDNSDDDDGDNSQQFTGDLAKTLKDIQDGQKELAEKFAKLETTPAPGTTGHEFTAPADGEDVSMVC